MLLVAEQYMDDIVAVWDEKWGEQQRRAQDTTNTEVTASTDEQQRAQAQGAPPPPPPDTRGGKGSTGKGSTGVNPRTGAQQRYVHHWTRQFTAAPEPEFPWEITFVPISTGAQGEMQTASRQVTLSDYAQKVFEKLENTGPWPTANAPGTASTDGKGKGTGTGHPAVPPGPAPQPVGGRP